MNRILIAGASLCALAALPLAGCTPEQEQQTVAGLQIACQGLAVGTTIAIQVSALVPGAAGAGAVAGVVQGAGGVACGTLIPAAQSLINSVTATGATAVVTATTVDPSGLKTVRRMQVTPAGRVIYSGTVAPSSGFGF